MCIVHNEEILVLLNFNRETSVYDGFTIFRNNDVEFYREWDTEDLAEIQLDNSKTLLNEIDLTGFISFESSLHQLDSKLTAVFTDDDFDSYYVGKIESINDNILSLQLISEKSEWLDLIELDIVTIWYVGFDSVYEKQLMKDAL